MMKFMRAAAGSRSGSGSSVLRARWSSSDGLWALAAWAVELGGLVVCSERAEGTECTGPDAWQERRIVSRLA